MGVRRLRNALVFILPGNPCLDDVSPLPLDSISMMKVRLNARAILVPALSLTVSVFEVVKAEPAKPNLIVTLADDLGLGDLSCYNRESNIAAPHADRVTVATFLKSQGYATACGGADLPVGAYPDSVCLLPVLLSPKLEKPVREHTVHLSFRGVFAIRQGPWKLVPGHRGSGGFSQPHELDPAIEGGPSGQPYHLGEDRAETRNRCDSEPEVVARPTKLLETIREDSAGR